MLDKQCMLDKPLLLYKLLLGLLLVTLSRLNRQKGDSEKAIQDQVEGDSGEMLNYI